MKVVIPRDVHGLEVGEFPEQENLFVRERVLQNPQQMWLTPAAALVLVICSVVLVCGVLSSSHEQPLRKMASPCVEILAEQPERPQGRFCGKSRDVCQHWETCVCFQGGCSCKANATYHGNKTCSSYICTTKGYVRKTGVDSLTQPSEMKCCEAQDCSAYLCPIGYVLKPNASSINFASWQACCDYVAEEPKCCYNLCGCPPFKHSWCGLSHCYLNYTSGAQKCRSKQRDWCPGKSRNGSV